MGKKSRIAGGTVGRRTILQLSPPGTRVGTSHLREEGSSGSEDESESDGHKLIGDGNVNMNMKGPVIKATEGLSLLGAYEDSDEEESDSQQTTKVQHNQSADIDSTLANFMAEIDAITTQPNSEDAPPHPVVPSPTPPRPENNVQQGVHTKGQEQPSTEADFQYNTQDSLAGVGVEMGDWQEVWDDNSGCYYYWSTVTNEVSWELPSYLANQVQGLLQCSNSATVNGNDTVEAAYYPEQKPALAHTPAIKKEAKVKEVMESVVAVASEEEERHGVAASLLAALIPPEVKVAEEKWRKRLLGHLEEGENGVDSDGETCGPAGSPSTPLRDSESLPVAPKEPRSKNQSQESSDAEEETEEDTVELELALERKKAELRALEEGDGSAGGSSPYSETSQEAPGSQGAALKKSRWKTAFISAASPDSNSISSDIQENVETAQLKSPEKPEEAEEMEADEAEDKSVVKIPAKDVEVETPELRFQIGELANTLTSKMEFLGINKKAISNFQLLLLQTETRIADWREGALNGLYLRRRLQEAAQHIKLYELNATPKGWSCHWDREHRRYFYVNDRTNVSRWDFPTKEELQDEPSDDQTSSQGETNATQTEPIACAPAAPPAPPPCWPPAQPQPPPPETPPPPADYPPPPPPPPGSPPPPPPPPDSDGDIMEVEMEMDDEDDGEPPAPGTEEDGSGRPPLPCVPARALDSSASSGKGQKRKAGHLNKAITIGSGAILYTQNTVSAASVMTANAYWGVATVGAPSIPAEVVAPPPPAPPVQPPLPLTQPPPEPSTAKALPTDKSKKLKKDKSKKTKTKMPSLVKKWQSIQKELDEEDKSSSSDEDRDQLNKRTIEEWKSQMLLTGKSNKNANFEALPVDWRERLKKRKKTNSM
ncbi:formin-binding protein 4 isoform X1 [Gadus chalcogrammus]|uniref:formin-binding protein 4 isoform X1 n=2 Tax=Gadus chalcogrammus TaxID=1042646 RepID=UPI0024C484AE|nr:formin-binding protein 4 isoform X1 [Gadus chalcogrammus]